MNTNLLEKLKALMTSRHLTLAVAESITCGRLQATLGAIGGASTFFEGGVTVYNLGQKTRLLGVDAQHAETVNSVSQRVAFELAGGICRLFESDIGIGTTGYAEASPENGIDIPMAYFALCRHNDGNIENISGRQIFGAGLSRVQMQQQVSDAALTALLAYLETGSAHA